jgi:signal transduction histidine kinase
VIKKLRTKFICINMIIVTVMLCFIFGLTVNLTRSAMEEESLGLLQSAVMPEKEKMEEGKQNPPTKPENKTPKPTDTQTQQDGSLSSAGKDTHRRDDKEKKDDKPPRLPTFTLRYDAGGQLLAQGSDFFDLTDSTYLQSLMDAAVGTGKEYGILNAQNLRFLRVENPSGVFYVFTDISNERLTVSNLMIDMLFISCMAFLAFLLISIFLSRWAVKPVEQAWKRQQQFVADASHELKTPLTVILTNAELMHDNDLPQDQRQQCVNHVLEMSQRMRNMTEELLSLAKTEIGRGVELTRCSLGQILEDAVMSFEPLLYEQGLELQTDLAQDLFVKGEETSLRQLAEILLDNARKYSLPGTVHMSLKRNNCKSCCLILSNPAQPVSKEELEQIFERFYRTDKARRSDGSFGLGLSIARSIVHRHKGTITADYTEGSITFTVQLPTL